MSRAELVFCRWRGSAEYGFGSSSGSAEHGFGSSSGSAEHGFGSPSGSAEHGFTLIEMLVALAIFSLAALALLRLEGATLTGTARLEETNVAQIVSRNLAVTLLTDPQSPTIGNTDGTVTNGGVAWHWTRDVSRTDDVRVVRIDLTVADPVGHVLTRLSIAKAVQ